MSKQFVRSAKNLVKGYSSTQVLVRNATSNDNHQVSKDSLIELAEKSYDSADFFEIMDMLDKRLNDKGKYWRHIAKALTVIDYLIRFGSENCVLWCRENLYIIKTLKEFRHEDDEGIDQGQIVRVKAKELTALLSDDERLNEERNMNIKGRNRKGRRRRGTGRSDENDDDLQRAIRYRQVSNDPNHNPFLNSQYTGLPSTSVVPTQTGYGFGNQSQQQSQNNGSNNRGYTLIDL
ncbi:ANM_HP_G0135730.mRNA.1.CDS.1 [Saccharomyces cerevisiae]|nr:ANM_HP_G0135730.mRNA.1.CDS.1 [Saccharomyces cerevisiae]CAI6703831.1 ANM_HP_G0135730.mRNA.1.CDS.1 [Saccharomyces cerevisiae]